MMRHRPVDHMPAVFQYLRLPDYHTNKPTSEDILAIAYVIREYVKPVSKQLDALPSVHDFASTLPVYDRMHLAERFILMQLSDEAFIGVSRVLHLPIFAETYDMYRSKWESEIKMCSHTFRSITETIVLD